MPNTFLAGPTKSRKEEKVMCSFSAGFAHIRKSLKEPIIAIGLIFLLGLMFPIVFFSAIRALIDPYLHAYLSENRMGSKPKQFTFMVLAIGAFVAHDSLLLLYLFYLKTKRLFLRLALLKCGLRRRHFLF